MFGFLAVFFTLLFIILLPLFSAIQKLILGLGFLNIANMI